MIWTLYFDGLCEPQNPGGWMVWAWALDDRTGSGFANPHTGNTNNKAEWYALGCGLVAVGERIKAAGKPIRLNICGDSMLVIKQLNNEWRCNDAHLRACRDRCFCLLNEMRIDWEAWHIPRDENRVADNLGRRKFREVAGFDPPVRAA